MAITHCLLADACPIGRCLGAPGNCAIAPVCPIAVFWRLRGCTDSVDLVMGPDGEIE